MKRVERNVGKEMLKNGFICCWKARDGTADVEKLDLNYPPESDDAYEAVKDLQEAKNQVVSNKERKKSNANEEKEEKQEETAMVVKAKHSDSSFDTSERTEGMKEGKLTRSESARGFRSIPSSPSLIFSGMKKRVDCMGKIPLVTGDYDDAEDEEGVAAKKIFTKSSFKTNI
nr:titin homolog [Ipomoea batatas]